MENYMDKYATPEEFIRAEVLANRGTQNVVDKSVLIRMVTENDPESFCYYSNLTKGQLFDLLVVQIGAKAYSLFPCGVSSHAFQLKFGIEHKDVQKMAKAGFISVTGKYRFRNFGKYLYAAVYNPYDYFRLTPEEVHTWIQEHSGKLKSPTSV